MLARSVFHRKEDRLKVTLTNWYEADPEINDEKKHMEDELYLRNSIILHTLSRGYDWKRKKPFLGRSKHDLLCTYNEASISVSP